MPVIEESNTPTLKELEDEWLELVERRKEIELDLEHAKIDQAAGRPFNLKWFQNATHAAAKLRFEALKLRVRIDKDLAAAKRKRKAENIAKAQSEADRRKNVKLDEFFVKVAKSVLSPEQFQTIMGLAKWRFDAHTKARNAASTKGDP